MLGERACAVVLPGPDALIAEIGASLAGHGYDVRQCVAESVSEEPLPEALVVPFLWFEQTASIEALGPELASLSDAIKSVHAAKGAYPKYVPVVAPLGGAPELAAGRGALSTFIGYLTSHLIDEDVRINAVLCRDDALGHQEAADAVRVLTSGLLDDVKGQVLRLEGRQG